MHSRLTFVRRAALPLLLATSVLAACGGGGDDDAADPSAGAGPEAAASADEPTPAPGEPAGAPAPDASDGSGVPDLPAESPDTPSAAASCAPDAILPDVRAVLESGGGVGITGVEVLACQNGFAHVIAEPDTSGCAGPVPCIDAEQVILRAEGDEWAFVTAGTGIGCGELSPPEAELAAACTGLGLP
jgi:hypothetical protein